MTQEEAQKLNFDSRKQTMQSTLNRIFENADTLTGYEGVLLTTSVQNEMLKCLEVLSQIVRSRADKNNNQSN